MTGGVRKEEAEWELGFSFWENHKQLQHEQLGIRFP